MAGTVDAIDDTAPLGARVLSFAEGQARMARGGGMRNMGTLLAVGLGIIAGQFVGRMIGIHTLLRGV